MVEIDVEGMVYAYLCQYHRGKESMIKNKDLRKLFGIRSDKSMRKIIQNIQSDKSYTKVIGSEAGKKGGYYICTTKEEIEETIKDKRHRANAILRYCHVLEWKSNLEG